MTMIPKLRTILSKDEVLDIIKAIPTGETIWIENENQRKTKWMPPVKFREASIRSS